MSAKKRTSKALALLIPTGVLGISSVLAAPQAQAETPAGNTADATAVANRLSDIRSAVSAVNNRVIEKSSSEKLLLAEWLNFGGGMGWRNGGWGNGGWHNGGWGNGGWHNWNNGWHNWHNFWHNW
jgi:rSAM-associated Gly-rich repeat protein